MNPRPWSLTLLMLLACRSTGTGPQPSPTTEASATDPTPNTAEAPSEAPAPAQSTRPRIERATSCASGSTTIADANVCLKLPDGYSAEAPQPGVQVFKAPGAPPITVRWQPSTSAFATMHADTLRRLADLDAEALTGETRDGEGTFIYAVETQPQTLHIAHASSTLHSGDTVAWCAASAPVHAKLPRSFFEACQSMMTAGT